MTDRPNQTTDLAQQILADAEPLAYERAQIDDPRFAEAGRVHDWRNYVPEVIQALWLELAPETRAAVFNLAKSRAGAEEWE